MLVLSPNHLYYTQFPAVLQEGPKNLLEENFMIRKVRGQCWHCSPHCGKALFPVYGNTRIEHLKYRCKACKNDIEVNI